MRFVSRDVGVDRFVRCLSIRADATLVGYYPSKASSFVGLSKRGFALVTRPFQALFLLTLFPPCLRFSPLPTCRPSSLYRDSSSAPRELGSLVLLLLGGAVRNVGLAANKH